MSAAIHIPWLAPSRRVSPDEMARIYSDTEGSEPVYTGPSLHEHLTGGQNMLVTLVRFRRLPPRPDFRHCSGCRIPSSPSSRRLLTAPLRLTPEAVERTCALIRVARMRHAVPNHW